MYERPYMPSDSEVSREVDALESLIRNKVLPLSELIYKMDEVGETLEHDNTDRDYSFFIETEKHSYYPLGSSKAESTKTKQTFGIRSQTVETNLLSIVMREEASRWGRSNKTVEGPHEHPLMELIKINEIKDCDFKKYIKFGEIIIASCSGESSDQYGDKKSLLEIMDEASNKIDGQTVVDRSNFTHVFANKNLIEIDTVQNLYEGVFRKIRADDMSPSDFPTIYSCYNFHKLIQPKDLAHAYQSMRKASNLLKQNLKDM